VLFEPFCPVDTVLFIAFYCSICCLLYLCLQINIYLLLSTQVRPSGTSVAGTATIAQFRATQFTEINRKRNYTQNDMLAFDDSLLSTSSSAVADKPARRAASRQTAKF